MSAANYEGRMPTRARTPFRALEKSMFLLAGPRGNGAFTCLGGLFLSFLILLGNGQTVRANAALPPDASPPATVTLDQDGPPAGSNSTESNAPETTRLTLFPTGDPFTPLLADPRQPTSNISFFPTSNNAYGQFNGTFGADIGIARWEYGRDGINRSFQVGVMGADFSRFAFVGSATYLEDADYVIGVPVTFRMGRFSGRIYFYHESSHTGYNYTRIANISKASDFGQEILQFVPSWDVTRHFRIYGGGAYRVVELGSYATFSDSLIGLAGFELYSSRLFLTPSRAYLAFNLESRGINGYTPSEDLQIGVLFHRPGSWFQVRPAMDFFNGYSPMGDLLFLKENYLSLGVYFDF